ncbi:MAG: glycosyltransferase family 39 protein [Alphaproteobacteria bacterium]|nr:glycosyltransferase family 39 protein [Alphaproteobacteria bacterium]
MLSFSSASLLSRDGKRLGFVAYALLVLLCLGLFLPGITSLPPTDRDESLFAQASKQMVETGNIVDIRVQEAPRYKKPIGIYWLQSASAKLFNPNALDEIWAYRIPSVLGATVAVAMTAFLGSLLFSPFAGAFAALMLAGCVLLNVEARLATTDAALLAAIVCAMTALARSAVLGVASTRNALLFWTAVAVGVLIKGPIILLPIAGVLLWFNTSDKKISWFLKLKPGWGLLYTLLLVAPWFIAIMNQSHGSFIQASAGNDMLAKIWQGQNRGALPPGLHLLALPILFFPASLFAFFAFPDIWKNRKDPAIKFCLGWIVPAWFIFELSLTKLPHYVLPLYPAIALLAGQGLALGFPSISAKNKGIISLIVGFWLVIGAALAFFFGGALPSLADRALNPFGLAAAVFLILAQGFALAQFMSNKVASLGVLTVASLVFLPTTFACTLPQLQHVWLSRAIVGASEGLKPCPNSRIISAGYHEPSLVFLAGTNTVLSRSAFEAAQALKKDACGIAAITYKEKEAFLNAFDDAARRPVERQVIEGLNSGRGRLEQVTLFTMPRETP